MKYVALLRGINVGGNHRVPMSELKLVLESLGATNVVTYLNSGNVIFEMPRSLNISGEKIEKALKKKFGFAIPTLLKTAADVRRVAKDIPAEWQNDGKQKTDIIYLFDSIDSKKILAQLPFNLDFVEVKYVKGALILHISDWKNYNKSRVNKIIGHSLYPYMTIRNVNTARFLASTK